jgi:hypothetical protein
MNGELNHAAPAATYSPAFRAPKGDFSDPANETAG